MMIIDKMKTLDHLTIQEKYLVDYIRYFKKEY